VSKNLLTSAAARSICAIRPTVFNWFAKPARGGVMAAAKVAHRRNKTLRGEFL